MGKRLVIVAGLAASGVTMLSGCAGLPIMDTTARFVASGAGRPSEAQIFNGFAEQRSQPAYSRGIVPGPHDPRFDDSSPFWFGHRRY